MGSGGSRTGNWKWKGVGGPGSSLPPTFLLLPGPSPCWLALGGRGWAQAPPGGRRAGDLSAAPPNQGGEVATPPPAPAPAEACGPAFVSSLARGPHLKQGGRKALKIQPCAFAGPPGAHSSPRQVGLVPGVPGGAAWHPPSLGAAAASPPAPPRGVPWTALQTQAFSLAAVRVHPQPSPGPGAGPKMR